MFLLKQKIKKLISFLTIWNLIHSELIFNQSIIINNYYRNKKLTKHLSLIYKDYISLYIKDKLNNLNIKQYCLIFQGTLIQQIIQISQKQQVLHILKILPGQCIIIIILIQIKYNGCKLKKIKRKKLKRSILENVHV